MECNDNVGMTNETLITYLKETGAIRTAAIENALRAVDRAKFVPAELRPNAYRDTALPIGERQTISQPTVVVYCLELLQVRLGDRGLDVGTGSGWTTALLAQLVGPTGSVVGVERIPSLVSFGSRNLSKFAYAHAHIEQTGTELGKPDSAPFDRILVSATADTVPEALTKQLKNGGRMVTPIQEAICAIDRTDDHFSTVCHEGYVFVPLITA